MGLELYHIGYCDKYLKVASHSHTCVNIENNYSNKEVPGNVLSETFTCDVRVRVLNVNGVEKV